MIDNLNQYSMKTLMMCMLVMASVLSFGQEKDDGQELIDTFFDYYKNRGPETALKYAFKTNKWIELEGDEMDNVIVKLIKEINVMGDYMGHEELKSKRVGSRIRMVSYLVYYLRDPIRFTIGLYKTNTGWEISHLDFDTKFDEELEESMKLSVGNVDAEFR